MKKIIMSFGIMLLCLFAVPASKADASAKLSTSKATIYVGKTTTLKVNGTKKKVVWTSNNKKVATVKNGKVTGRKAGKAVITAKVGKQKMTCKVTVKNQSLNHTKLDLTVGKTAKLKVNGAYRKVTYKTSNKKIVSVDKNGKVKAEAPGTAKITVRHNGKNFICKVTVKKPESSELVLKVDKKMMTDQMAVYVKQLDVKKHTSDNSFEYYTVTRTSYNNLVDQIKKDMKANIDKELSYQNYMKETKVNDSFTVVDSYVYYDKEDDWYDEFIYDWYDEVRDCVGETCAYYQALHGVAKDQLKITINIVDQKTNKKLGTRVKTLGWLFDNGRSR